MKKDTPWIVLVAIGMIIGAVIFICAKMVFDDFCQCGSCMEIPHCESSKPVSIQLDSCGVVEVKYANDMTRYYVQNCMYDCTCKTNMSMPTDIIHVQSESIKNVISNTELSYFTIDTFQSAVNDTINAKINPQGYTAEFSLVEVSKIRAFSKKI